MFGKLNLVFQDLLIARSAEVQIFIEKIVKAEDLIAGEADKGIETMKGIENKTQYKTGFLYCPRCGLRRPKSEDLGNYGGYCPYCGSKMIDEGSLPYKAKSNLNYRTILKFK
jgi:DNA-directed RNA polymerase subunit RPC12/RpoP